MFYRIIVKTNDLLQQKTRIFHNVNSVRLIQTIYASLFCCSKHTYCIWLTLLPPHPLNSFHIFQTSVSGLSSSWWFKDGTTNVIYLRNKRNQKKISNLQKVFRRSKAIWVRWVIKLTNTVSFNYNFVKTCSTN